MKITSFQFRVVLCRIRNFPILISKIKWIGSELPLTVMSYYLIFLFTFEIFKLNVELVMAPKSPGSNKRISLRKIKRILGLRKGWRKDWKLLILCKFHFEYKNGSENSDCIYTILNFRFCYFRAKQARSISDGDLVAELNMMNTITIQVSSKFHQGSPDWDVSRSLSRQNII